MASMAGISAGILGLTALKGFIFYFIASFFMSVSTAINNIYDFYCKINYFKYRDTTIAITLSY